MALERTRRRALQIFVGSAACALTPRAGASPYQWRGAALGADVSILFSDTLESRAERAVAGILDEIERLEAVFSLQRLDSELSRLNATGRLQAPSPDFLHVLSLAAQAHRITAGRFDPTVQPLWRFYLDWYAGDRARARPPEDEIAAARSRVGFARVRIAAEQIVLPARFGVTLNGIAQGYITDRACGLLRAAGFGHVLVDLGETRALDARADGRAWRIELPDGRAAPISTGAIATSAGAATQFAENGDHHIFDPVTGRPARFWRWLSVSHASATLADALSTGFYCLPPDEALRAASSVSGVRLWGETLDGKTVEG